MAVYSVGPPVAVAGFRSGTWSDQRIANIATLYDRAKRRLADLQAPEASYRVSAADLSEFRIADEEALTLGEEAHLTDDDLGFDLNVQVVELEKDLGDSGRMTLTLKSVRRDLADYIAEIMDGGAVGPSDPSNLTPDSISLDDWVYDDTDYIDGGQIARGTLPETFHGTITEDQTVGSAQAYQVRFHDPATGTFPTAQRLIDLGWPSSYVDGARVADDDAAPLSVGDEVSVTVPSIGQAAAGEEARIGAGTGAGVVAGAQYLFVANEGD